MRSKRIIYVLTGLFMTAVFVACAGQQQVPQQEEAMQATTTEEPQADALEEEAEQEQEIVTTYTEEALLASYQERTNKALEYLLRAQIALAEGLPNNALYQINLSLAILQTADGLAYKGSILYVLGRHDEARAFWEQAYQMDSDAIHTNLPGIPEGLQ